MDDHKQIELARYKFASILRGFTKSTDMAVTLSAGLLYQAKQQESVLSYRELLSNIVFANGGAVSAVRQLIPEAAWNALSELLPEMSAETLRGVALYNNNGMNETPPSFVELGKAIMHIESNDTVADLCCGTGSFLTALAETTAAKSFYGCDIDPTACDVARLKAEIVSETRPGIQVRIDTTDAIYEGIKTDLQGKFSKVFSNYPFGIRMKKDEKLPFLKYISEKVPSVRRIHSADWLFLYASMEMLTSDGVAAVILPDGPLFNLPDQDIRKHFVRQGWIKAIIKLPQQMFQYTTIKCNMMLLSYGNESIRFVDASGFFHSGRRYNVFTEEDISSICRLLEEDSELVIAVGNQDVLKNDAHLIPESYLKTGDDKLEQLNSTPLNKVSRSITRGAPMNSKALDSLISKEPTEYQFLTLSDIQDGKIQSDLSYLTTIDAKQKKYCLQNGDIILSKNSSPFKVATADGLDRQVLANGNLYIIRLRQDLILPYYLQAFFQSASGQKALDGISQGSVFSTISVDALRNLEIPLPPMEVQKKIAEEFEDRIQELSILKNKMNRVRKSSAQVFDEIVSEHLKNRPADETGGG